MKHRNATVDKVMSFGEHLEELRRRLGLALLGLLPILIASMLFAKSVMAFLLLPAERALHAANQPARMLVTGVLEGFNSYFYLALIMALLVGAPWLLYQLWLFIAPGLYAGERRFVYLAAPLSLVLTILSAFFTYYIMLPAILTFFVHFNLSLPNPPVTTAPLPAGVTLPVIPVLSADPPAPALGEMWINTSIDELRVCTHGAAGSVAAMVVGTPVSGAGLLSQQYKLSQYIDLLFNFSLAFAAGFQMPVVVLLLGWVGIITPELLKKYRRHALFTCAILGAALTPGDPLSATLLTVPLYILFELGLLLLKWFPASKVAGDREAQRASHIAGASSDGEGGGP